MTDREKLLTPQEVADWLRVKISWVYQRSHAKTLPFPSIRVGTFLRFPESGIQAYLQRLTQGGGHDV